MPLLLFILCGLFLGGTGGPLLWPMCMIFFGAIGVVSGFAVRAELQQQKKEAEEEGKGSSGPSEEN